MSCVSRHVQAQAQGEHASAAADGLTARNVDVHTALQCMRPSLSSGQNIFCHETFTMSVAFTLFIISPNSYHSMLIVALDSPVKICLGEWKSTEQIRLASCGVSSTLPLQEKRLHFLCNLQPVTVHFNYMLCKLFQCLTMNLGKQFM